VLEGLEFDEEAREMLGLDDIQEILGDLDDDERVVDVEEMEQEAQAVKSGEATADIKDPDKVIDEMDSEMDGGGAQFNSGESSDEDK